jgi:hypothetical protein
MKINVKTFAGIGVGLVAGYFLFKNADKKYLKIGGVGLAGGLLANLLLNRVDSKKPINLSTKEYINQAEDELTDSETGNIQMDEKSFDVPNIQQTQSKDYFDIDLGFNQ